MTTAVGRRGFTLVEILVVLVILVLLFGLLFMPMMTGLELARLGRVQTHMQDSVREAMEWVRRDLSDAVYVYPSPIIMLAGPNGSLGDADDEAVTNYSQVVFVKAARDADGGLITPIAPERVTDGEMKAIRYLVKLSDTAAEWSDANTFVLYRQEGFYRWDPVAADYVFGRKNAGVFEPDVPETENAMTATRNMDIPPTSTVCLDCGASTVGYAAQCPAACGSTDVVHLHNAVRFAPQRIVGDTLAASEFNTLYTAGHGNWRGFANDGTIFLPGTALSPLESQMQPRIRLYRYNQTAGSHSDVALDSMTTTRSDVQLRWNAHGGTVRIGDYETVRIEVDPADLTSPPARGAGHFYSLDVTDLDDAGVVDSYDENGAPGAARVTSVAPIYGAAPTGWQDPLMPIGFAIHPDDVDGVAATAPAKVVPHSAVVRVVATLTDGSVRRAEYSVTQEYDQEQIGQYQFAQFQQGDDRRCEIRFNRWSPPSPEMFGTLSGFYIDILYYHRRNFDATSNRDDIVIVDYSTAELMNIALTLSMYVEPEPYSGVADVMVVPSDNRAPSVTMRDQVKVRNIR